MKKKVLLSFFALLAVLVLAACGNAGNTTPDGSGSTTSGDNVTTSGNSENNENHEEHVHTLSDWISSDTKHWRTCSECNEVFDMGDHGFTMSKTDPTCEQEGSITYTCGICGYTKTTKIDKLQHVYNQIEYIDETDEEHQCKHHYISMGVCDDCHEEVELSRTDYETHEYKVKQITEATCTTKGSIQYECIHCNAAKVEEFTNSDAHVWNEGTKNGNIITYTCTLCNATKQAIDASDAITATVAKEDLANREVALEKATVKLDNQTLEGIGDVTNVSIKADTVDVESLAISNSIKEKIGNNDVFDFSMETDGNSVSEFNGKVTITIPYTLKETDDPESIVIWYINDAGDPETIEAKYANGYVTFETSHFSLYVVIQMTAQDACDLFGHNYEEVKTVPSTCLVQGYRMIKCSRCNDILIEQLELANHNWVLIENIEATSTTSGYKVYQCSYCNEIKITEVPKKTNNEQSKIAKILNGIINLVKTDGIEILEHVGPAESTDSKRALMKVQGNIVYLYSDIENGYSVTKMDFNSKKTTRYNIQNDYITMSESDIEGSSLENFQLFFGEDGNAITDILTIYFDTNLINTWTDKILNLVFTVENVNGNIEYRLDNEKVLAVYEDVTTLTVQQFIDKYIDPMAYLGIIQFATKAKDMTIGEIIDEIGSYGIDFNGLIDYVFNNAETFGLVPSGSQEAPTPDQIKAMINQYREEKLVDLLAKIPNNQMTFDNILEMLNRFGAMKVEELIASMRPTQTPLAIEEMPVVEAPLVEPVLQPQTSIFPPKEYIEQLLDTFALTITFDNNYVIKGINFEGIIIVDDEPLPASFSIIAAQNAMEFIKEKEAAAKTEIAKFVINEDTNILGEAFNKAFKTNLKFNYSTSNGKIIIRTSPIYYYKLNEILTSAGFDNKLSLYKETADSFYFVFEINNENYYRHSSKLSSNMWTTGVDGRLSIYANTEFGPQLIDNTNLGALFSNIVYLPQSNEYYLSRYYIGSSNIISLTTEEEARGKIEEKYSYLYDSIKALINAGKLEAETIYYKKTNIATGESKYYTENVYYYLENGTKYYLHDQFDYSEIYTFPYLLNYNSENIYIHYFYDGTKLNMEFDSYAFRELDKNSGEYIYKNLISNDGSFRFEYQSDSTEYIIHYKLTIGNNSYDLYDDSGKPYTQEDIVAEVYYEGCDSIALYKSGNYVDYTHRSGHELESKVLINPTATQDGIRIVECKKCDYNYYDIIRPTTTEQIVLEDCTANFSDATAPIIGYYFNGVDQYYAFEWLTKIFDVGITILEKDESGEYVLSEDAGLYFPEEYDVTIFEFEKYAIKGRYFTFDQDVITDLTENLTENQKIAVVATNRESTSTSMVACLILE